MVDYDFYSNDYWGDSIPEKDFRRIIQRAKEKIGHYEHIYAIEYYDPSMRDMALCAVADNLYYQECLANGLVITSSSIGSVHTTSKASTGPQDTEDNACLKALRLYANVYRGA